MIACVHIPEFAATIERRCDPALAGQALVLGQDEHVYAASREALRHGVIPGIALGAARARCPAARVLGARPGEYAEALAPVQSRLTAIGAPLELEEGFQDATWYLDLGNNPPRLAIELAVEMGKAAREESGLEPSVGIAVGKFPARVAATDAAPNRARFVAPGCEAPLLASLPLEALPMDGEIVRRLHLLGIRTLGQFAALPASAVAAQFGREGQRFHKLAQGRDERPVRPRVARPSEQVEQLFDDPIADQARLEAAIGAAAVTLSRRLQDRVLGAKALWLLFDLEDGSRRERRRTLHEPVAGLEALQRTFKALLKQMWIRSGVVALRVMATELMPLASAASQLSFFQTQPEEERAIQERLPHLVARFGADRFLRIASANPEALLLERRFRLQATDGI